MNENSNNINTNFPTNISCRLTLKNIPENLSNQQLLEILYKNFDTTLKDITISKLEHKYNSKNNKICFVTADTFETRKKVFSFFSTFDIIDPKGFKQKISVVDCLFQGRYKSIKDSVEGTIEKMDHFEKFKEYFNNENIVDFKQDELKFLDTVFDGIEEIIKPIKQNKTTEEKGKISSQISGKPSKMIIMKKGTSEFQKEIEVGMTKEIQQTNFIKNSDIEIIPVTQSNEDYNSGKYNKNKNYKKGYSGGNKKYYDNGNYYEENGNYYEEGYNKSYSGNKSYNNSYNNYNDSYNNSNYNNEYYNESYNNSYNYKKSGSKKNGYK